MAIATTLSVAAGLAVALPILKEAADARATAPQSGAEGLVGAIGTVLELPTPGDPQGWVRLKGERWKFRSAEPLAVGAQVRVDSVAGLEVAVSPVAAGNTPRARSGIAAYRRWFWGLGGGLWLVAVAWALLSGGSMVGAVLGCPGAGALLLLLFSGFENAA